MEDNITVVYSNNSVLLTLGDHGLELTRAEAEQLFVDLGYALREMDECSICHENPCESECDTNEITGKNRYLK